MNKQSDDNPSKPISPDFQHERVIHRLNTARWVIWGGLTFIALISVFYFFLLAWVLGDDGVGITTIFMTVISTIASIVTLALGYIAGSNIQR